jgi:hypothetical protein
MWKIGKGTHDDRELGHDGGAGGEDDDEELHGSGLRLKE